MMMKTVHNKESPSSNSKDWCTKRAAFEKCLAVAGHMWAMTNDDNELRMLRRQ